MMTTAQLLTVSDASIVIDANVEIHVRGDVTTAGNSAISNDGTLYIAGDLIHNASGNCFGDSQGKVVLNGDQPQLLSGVSAPVFNDLILAGLGSKHLAQNIQVGGAYMDPTGVLQLNDRQLHLNGHSLTVRNNGINAIERTTGFIVSETDTVIGYGRVKWDIGQPPIGSTYVFPFGNSDTDHYLPITVSISASGSGLGGSLTMATYPTDPAQFPNNRPLPEGLTELTGYGMDENAAHVLDRWWIMETEGYSQAPIATLAFHYRDSEWNGGNNAISESGLMLQDHFNGAWQYPPSAIDIVQNRLNTVSAPFRNSLWTAASMLHPLPIELIAFSGERLDADRVELQWSTATEKNNAGFEIWRRMGIEQDFQHVGWVDGVGNSTTRRDYALIDPSNTREISYYFLRQVDDHGTFEDSPMISVKGSEANNEWRLYPNPAKDGFMIMGEYSLAGRSSLLDGAGRMIREWPVNGQEYLSLNGLAPGVYLVRFEANDGRTSSQRLVIE